MLRLFELPNLCVFRNFELAKYNKINLLMVCAMILHDENWSIIDKVTDHFNVTLSNFIPYFCPIHDFEWRNFHEIRSIICNWHIEVIVPRKRENH